MSENEARLRNMCSKSAYQSMIQGFWATRVANGLTTPEDAAARIQEQFVLLGSWYPDREDPDEVRATAGVSPKYGKKKP